jgi:hypothetical protein
VASSPQALLHSATATVTSKGATAINWERERADDDGIRLG